jgi:hypothetical protein
MENKETAHEDARKLTFVVVFMSVCVAVLFGIIPLV